MILKQTSGKTFNVGGAMINSGKSQVTFLCRLRSIATHRDHFVRWPSVRLSHFPKLCFAGDTCIPRNAATIFCNYHHLSLCFIKNIQNKCKYYEVKRFLILSHAFQFTVLYSAYRRVFLRFTLVRLCINRNSIVWRRVILTVIIFRWMEVYPEKMDGTPYYA